MGICYQLQKINSDHNTELFELYKWWPIFPEHEFIFTNTFPDLGAFMAEALSLGHRPIMAATLYHRLKDWAGNSPICCRSDNDEDHQTPSHEDGIYVAGDYSHLIKDVNAVFAVRHDFLM